MNFYTLITNVGKSKIANATVLGEKVALKTIQVGDGGGQYYEPSESQTQLRNKVWEGQIGKIEVDTDNPNWIITESVIPSKVGGFTIREVGIFDTEGDLIIIAKYPETYKPQLANGSTKDLILRTIIEVTNAESIALKIDATVVLATKKDIDVLEQKLNKKIEGITVPVISVNEKTGAIVLKAKDIECDDMHTIEQNITELQDQFEALELTAEKVTITDHDGNFVGENVEEALRENATKIKQAKQEATTATEKANAAQQAANVAQQSANNAKSQADTALQKANEAFQNGVNTLKKLATVLTSKGINVASCSNFECVMEKIRKLKTENKAFNLKYSLSVSQSPQFPSSSKNEEYYRSIAIHCKNIATKESTGEMVVAYNNCVEVYKEDGTRILSKIIPLHTSTNRIHGIAVDLSSDEVYIIDNEYIYRYSENLTTLLTKIKFNTGKIMDFKIFGNSLYVGLDNGVQVYELGTLNLQYSFSNVGGGAVVGIYVHGAYIYSAGTQSRRIEKRNVNNGIYIDYANVSNSHNLDDGVLSSDGLYYYAAQGSNVAVIDTSQMRYVTSYTITPTSGIFCRMLIDSANYLYGDGQGTWYYFKTRTSNVIASANCLTTSIGGQLSKNGYLWTIGTKGNIAIFEPVPSKILLD